jgi:hypothetical protein
VKNEFVAGTGAGVGTDEGATTGAGARSEAGIFEVPFLGSESIIQKYKKMN